RRYGRLATLMFEPQAQAEPPPLPVIIDTSQTGADRVHEETAVDFRCIVYTRQQRFQIHQIGQGPARRRMFVLRLHRRIKTFTSLSWLAGSLRRASQTRFSESRERAPSADRSQTRSRPGAGSDQSSRMAKRP